MQYEREIFVFGSNEAGRHGKGAALHAKNVYGARNGIGEGLTGNAYALPTKDSNLNSLPIGKVFQNIKTFCDFARENPTYRFLVTPVGTGLAGFSKRNITYGFKQAVLPSNCVLTSSWIND